MFFFCQIQAHLYRVFLATSQKSLRFVFVKKRNFGLETHHHSSSDQESDSEDSSVLWDLPTGYGPAQGEQ